jgi:methyl-accepting chemotaxis protein
MRLSDESMEGATLTREPDVLAGALGVLNSAVVLGLKDITSSMDRVQAMSEGLATITRTISEVAKGTETLSQENAESMRQTLGQVSRLVAGLREDNQQVAAAVSMACASLQSAMDHIALALRERRSYRMSVKRNTEGYIDSAEFSQI